MKIFSITTFNRQLISKLRLNLFLVILLVFVASCDNLSKETPSEETEVPEKVTIQKETKNFEIVDFSKSLNDEAKNLNAQVNISYPSFLKSKDNNAAYNDLIVGKVSSIVKDYILERPKSASLETLSKLFLESYADFKESFPENESSWHLKINSTVSFQAKDFLSISIETSSYTGGAHANSSVTYLNISSKGKEVNDLGYFFKNSKKVRQIAEEAFRQSQKIKAEEHLSDKGFLFENDKFALSETFGFTPLGLVLHYNPYEISSYAEGAIEVLIPFEKIKDQYKF